MNAGDKDLTELQHRLRRFAEARDWVQFHAPKNLVMALVVEAAELVEHFQWLTPAESLELPETRRHAVALEMADVLIYLLRLADRLDIDLLGSALEKIDINERRFPVDEVRGKAE